MPHREDSTITIKELHPTFAAEVHGVNFQGLTDEQFDEVYKAITKVSSRGRCFRLDTTDQYSMAS